MLKLFKSKDKPLERDEIRDRRNREAMLKQVYDTWVRGILEKSLYTEVLWVENQALLLLLDGLDEVALERREDCVKYGGQAVIKHYLLRYMLSRRGYIPKRKQFVPFLDYAASLVFLRKVGGGYIFIHRLLLEHFAAKWNADDTQS